jgi:hypothetical protein
VAAVQEFAAALRSDLVSLSEKVSKLEGTVGDLSGKVSTLQRNAFTISGSLTPRATTVPRCLWLVGSTATTWTG